MTEQIRVQPPVFEVAKHFGPFMASIELPEEVIVNLTKMTDKLIATARDNMLRISPLKLSLIANSIVNKKVSNAVNQLKFSNKRIASSVLKVLNSAVANAENNNQLDIDKLFIKEAFVGKSLRMKRWRPRAKGRAASIIKPFSKLTIVVEERVNSKEDK